MKNIRILILFFGFVCGIDCISMTDFNPQQRLGSQERYVQPLRCGISVYRLDDGKYRVTRLHGPYRNINVPFDISVAQEDEDHNVRLRDPLAIALQKRYGSSHVTLIRDYPLAVAGRRSERIEKQPAYIRLLTELREQNRNQEPTFRQRAGRFFSCCVTNTVHPE